MRKIFEKIAIQPYQYAIFVTWFLGEKWY